MIKIINGRKKNKKLFIDKIKKDYCINEIFSFLKIKSEFNLVKYSKYLQKILNINYEQYIIYNELFKNYNKYNEVEELYKDIKTSKNLNKTLIFKEEILNLIKRFIIEKNNFYYSKLKTINLKPHYSSVLRLIKIDENRFLSSSLDRTMRIYSINNFKIEKILKGHIDDVSCIILDKNDKNIIYSGSDDKTIKIWNLKNGKCLNSFKAHDEILFDLTIINNNKYLISCAEETEIHIYKISEILLSNIIPYKIINYHKNSVTKLFSIENNINCFLISGSCDSNINLYDINNFNLINQLFGHNGTIYSFEYFYDKNYLISGSEDKSIKIWNLFNYECIYTFENAHFNDITSLNFTNDFKSLFSSSIDETIIKWNFKNYKKEYIIKSENNPINSILLMNDNILICGYENGKIKLIFYNEEDNSKLNGGKNFFENHPDNFSFYTIKYYE